MIITRQLPRLLTTLALFAFLSSQAEAVEPFRIVSERVNQKLVKLFGAGGFRGVTNYGTGIIISPQGHLLTTASHMLDTSELIAHLADGRRMRASVLVVEPELDIALCQLKGEGAELDKQFLLDLDFFDIAAASKRPPAEAGDWVLAFSNLFEIAMRDEPVSVQRGVIAAYSKLHGRRGIFDFPYTGPVYIVDAITNNPGAGGGALTDRNGELLGIIGREIRNSLTDTWVNYAIPVHAQATIQDGEKTVTISIPEFVRLGMLGQYKPVNRTQTASGPGGYHGIEFVPNVLERTPPYVEAVKPDSPAAKAGLRPDDLVSFIDGEPIYSIQAFDEYMKATRPGMTIRLEIRRGDRLETVEMKLDAYPKRSAAPALKSPMRR